MITIKTLMQHTHEILIKVDEGSQMAAVLLNGELVMTGNFWDFHPGCHGIVKYGDFRGYIDLSRAIYQWLIKEKKVDFRKIKTTKINYKWDE